jgi:hypothetical protein
MIKPHTSLLAIFCFVALVGYAGMSSQAEPKLVTESYMIQSRDPGIQLYVRNSPPYGFFLLNGDMELNRYREPFVQKMLKELKSQSK